MMAADWAPLDQELAIWQKRKLRLPLWWRDDDAVEPTTQLEQLSALSRETGLPVFLAVIPSQATQELAGYITGHPELIPVVHGWAHQNHAEAGSKKCEFASNRPLADLKSEAQKGHKALAELFGERLLPMFVPPWNRISKELIPDLPLLGYKALSTFTPRSRDEAAPGLTQINTHLDPVDWKGTRSLCPPDQLIRQVANQLADRRTGVADNTEPYGILTHHLVHDPAIWAFTAALITRLMAGPGYAWYPDRRTL